MCLFSKHTFSISSSSLSLTFLSTCSMFEEESKYSTLKPALHYPFNWNQLVLRHNYLKHVGYYTFQLIDGNYLKLSAKSKRQIFLHEENLFFLIFFQHFFHFLAWSFICLIIRSNHQTCSVKEAAQKTPACARVPFW